MRPSDPLFFRPRGTEIGGDPDVRPKKKAPLDLKKQRKDPRHVQDELFMDTDSVMLSSSSRRPHTDITFSLLLCSSLVEDVVK